MNVLILIVAVFKINMNKNGVSVKYFTGHQFFFLPPAPQLTPAEKTEIKNLCHAAPYLVISE